MAVAARELGALRAHPGLQIGHERRAEFLANRLAPFCALTVDGPLDLEQGVDPADCFQRQRGAEQGVGNRLQIV
jgi:hypothetical protein